MIKKVFATVLCVLMIASLIPFTVGARVGVTHNAAFKICVATQDSKSVTITLDCTNEAGFCAFDASIKYNNLKLSLEDCQFASGFAAFKQYVDSQSGMTIFNVNSDINPVKVSIATTVPFTVIEGDGAILKIKFSKIQGANISESDISLTVDNCQNGDFEDIKTSVAYDFTTGSSSSASDLIIESGKLPEEEAKIIDGSKTTTAADDKKGAENNAAADAEQPSENESTQANASTAPSEQNSPAKADKGLSNSKKTVIIIVIMLVLIFGIGALVLILNKNKKSA